MATAATVQLVHQQAPAPIQAPRKAKTILGLAITQLLLGLSILAVGIGVHFKIPGPSRFKTGVTHVYRPKNYNLIESSGGLWGGVCIIYAGIIGVLSARNLTNRDLSISYIVFTITSTCASLVAIIFVALALSYHLGTTCVRLTSTELYCFLTDRREAGMHVALLVLLIVELGVSITATTFSFNFFWNQGRTGVVGLNQYQGPVQAQYTTQTAQPMVMQPYAGQPIVAHPIGSQVMMMQPYGGQPATIEPPPQYQMEGVSSAKSLEAFNTEHPN